jgi:hypothetical protein
LKKNKKDPAQAVWTLHCLLKMAVANPVNGVVALAQEALRGTAISPLDLVRRFPKLKSPDCVELRLYDHQRDLFAVPPGLVLYEAPTGTGKTLSPIGLAERKDVQMIVFLCGSRNVCLSLAQKCLSVDIRVAFAFGSQGPSDVRIHNSAAKTFHHRDERTGAKRGINHMDGSMVQVAICDLPSAPSLFAWLKQQENYDPSKYVLYWDDCTAGLDRADHPMQGHIRAMWEANEIPFIIMASATLPDASALGRMTEAYTSRFGLPVHSIKSTKVGDTTVSLLDTENYVAMPHHCCTSKDDGEAAVDHLRKRGNLLRYVDLAGAVDVLCGTDEARWAAKFATLSDVTSANIKAAYLDILPDLGPTAFRRRLYKSTVEFMTADAYTITDPALFVADDLGKVVKFCLGFLNKSIISALEGNLRRNEEIRAKILQLRKKLDDLKAADGVGDKKAALNRLSPEALQVEEQIQALPLLAVELPQRYVPNSADHQRIWIPVEKAVDQPYTADLDAEVAQKILESTVSDEWKLLLLTGIGGFFKEAPSGYLEIVKSLANEKRLYMIIADTDYIYGTSYPFGHIYVGKDLPDLTQSKCIQVCGRVGRYKGKDATIRLRDNAVVRKLFLPSETQIEADMINTLLV